MRPLPIAAFVAPIIAAPSGRGLVPVLLIVGMWALIDMVKNRRHAIKNIFVSPLFFWVIAISGFALISASWAMNPERAIKVGLNFFGIGVFGLAMLTHARYQSEAEWISTRVGLVVGVTIAVALLAVGTYYGLIYEKPLWGKPNQHPLATLSHGQVAIAVFILPTLAMLWEAGAKARIWAAILLSIITVTYFHLEHSASTIAICAGGLVLVVVGTTKRYGFLAVCAGLAIAVIAMPFLTDALVTTQDTLDSLTSEDGAWSSATHRMFMWRFATDTIIEGPLALGFGAGASRGIPEAAEKVMWGIELMPLHPHNGALQVWLEMGIIGAAIFAILGIVIYRATKHSGGTELGIYAAMMVAFIAPWMLSYGIWQSWWLALGWLAAAIGRGILEPIAP
jgi:exopolysaccharide production protein ExoQ